MAINYYEIHIRFTLKLIQLKNPTLFPCPTLNSYKSTPLFPNVENTTHQIKIHLFTTRLFNQIKTSSKDIQRLHKFKTINISAI